MSQFRSSRSRVLAKDAEQQPASFPSHKRKDAEFVDSDAGIDEKAVKRLKIIPPKHVDDDHSAPEIDDPAISHPAEKSVESTNVTFTTIPESTPVTTAKACDEKGVDSDDYLSAWAMLRGREEEQDGSSTESDGGRSIVKLKDGPIGLFPLQSYNLPTKCEVYDPEEQAEILKDLYKTLPNLSSKIFLRWNEKYTGAGRMNFGTWDQYCPYMDLRKGLKAMKFVSYQRVFHLARCDPRIFAARTTPHSSGGRTMTVNETDAAIVSLVPLRLTNSCVTETNEHRRKLVTGIMHSQDMERFVSVVCTVFGEDSMHCNLKNDEFTFETRPAAEDGPSPSNSPHKASRAARPASSAKAVTVSSPSSACVSAGSGITAGYIKTSLSGADQIRVYDGRKKNLNWASDIGKVHTILPLFEGELLPGSFVVVAHTITSYRKTVRGAVVGETASLNLQWVLLLGSPDQKKPRKRRQGAA